MIATATSKIRPPRSGRAPVVSTYTTAKRHPVSAKAPQSEIIAPYRPCHTTRCTAAPDQLHPFDGNHRAFIVRQALFAREEVHRGHGLEPAMLELAQRGFVPHVGHRDARPHRDEIAGGRPLLALLQRAVRAAAEHGLEWLIDRLHRGEEVRHLLDRKSTRLNSSHPSI